MLLVSGTVVLSHAVADVSVPELGVVAATVCLHQLESLLATLAEFLKLYQPRLQLIKQQLVLAVALHC